MEIQLPIVFWSMFNFFLIVLIGKYFFFDKVKKIIDERENDIKDNIDKAEEDAEKASEEAMKEYLEED